MVQRMAAGEIAALDPYTFMALIGKRIIHPGGHILVAGRKPAESG